MNQTNGLKVVHFTSAHPPSDSRIFVRECRALAANGYDVTIIAPRSEERPVDDGVYDGVTFRQVDRSPTRLRAVITDVWRVFRQVRRTPASIYHFHDPELILVGYFLHLTGKLVIYDSHENSCEAVLTASWIPARLRPLARWLFAHAETFVASRIAGVVAANPAILSRFEGTNDNLALVSNYPSVRDFEKESTRLSPRIPGKVVNFGGISSHTCIESVVDAFGRLDPALNSRLTIAGSIFSRKLLDSISAHPAWSRITFLGRVTRSDILQHLRTASVAVVLYSPEPNHFGVGSNRFFEAMAAGVPVVTSNFPAWREIVEGIGCGITVDPMQPAEVARAINYLLSHPAQAAEMGRRGQKAFRDRFNWEHDQQALLGLYHKLSRPHASTGTVTSPVETPPVDTYVPNQNLLTIKRIQR